MKLPPKIQNSLYQLFVFSILWLIIVSTTEARGIFSHLPANFDNNSSSLINQRNSERLFQAQANFTSTQIIFLPVIMGGSGSVRDDQTVVNAVPPSIAQQSSNSFTVFLPLIFNSQFCNYVIAPSLAVANAKTNYAGIKPGDRVCIQAGTRNRLTLQNFTGTAEKPIIFINFGGQVIFNQTSDFGIAVHNSRFIHLSGTGDPSVTYGFKVNGNYTAGLNLQRKTSDFEVDHFEITNTNLAGIYAKTDANCPDGSTNEYDYDGDGNIKGDLDDVVTRQNFTQYNSLFHDNYIHQVGTEGLYIGNSFYDVGETLDCANGSQNIISPVLKGVKVYDNIVDQTGWDGIQVGSAVQDCEIFNNQIYQDSQSVEVHQQSGIMNNRGSICNIYNNLIKDGGGSGVYVQGNGNNKIYNNIIIQAGQNIADNTGYGIKLDTGSNLDNSIHVLNNTIIQPRKIGISFLNRQGSDNRIQNNIIIQPGDGSDSYIVLGAQTQVIVSNNFTSNNIADAGFVNPEGGDYSLRSNSSVIDSGLNLSPQGITIDYIGVARPQGANYDPGAYEFVLGTPVPPTPTLPTTTATPKPTITPTPTLPSPTPTRKPTLTKTPTSVPPTSTSTPANTPTPTYTSTSVPPADTPTNTATPTDTPTP